MHPRVTVTAALELGESGMNATDIARVLGVPRATVRDWLYGQLPRRDRMPAHSTGHGCCERCDGDEHDFTALPSEYVYLLDLYLGDGCISPHPRGVYKLRIVLDAKYPGIVGGAAAAVGRVRGAPASVLERRDNCVEVYSYWKSSPCLLPQHGRGKKYARSIVLADWQRQLVTSWPEHLLKGLINSDGCRFQNLGRNKWSHPRYSFSQRSDDITRIFCETCEMLGIRWTAAGGMTIYVSRKADVATLDRFIGPKR